MDNLNVIRELAKELFHNIRQAKMLVDDGKEVACSRSLQGAKTRCEQLISNLEGDPIDVAEEVC